MSKATLVDLVACVVSTLAEFDDFGAAESTIYLGLGMDIHAYQIVRDALVGSGLCVTKADRIMLTTKGRELGDKLNAAMA